MKSVWRATLWLTALSWSASAWAAGYPARLRKAHPFLVILLQFFNPPHPLFHQPYSFPIIVMAAIGVTFAIYVFEGLPRLLFILGSVYLWGSVITNLTYAALAGKGLLNLH